MNEDNILPKDMNDTDVSRPQQGLSIMNFEFISQPCTLEYQKRFPSPTGVTYYKFALIEDSLLVYNGMFPSPTGATYYEYDENT